MCLRSNDAQRPIAGYAHDWGASIMRGVEAGWGINFYRFMKPPCTCLEKCGQHGCPRVDHASQCSTALSCIPTTVQLAAFFLLSNNSGVMRYPPVEWISDDSVQRWHGPNMTNTSWLVPRVFQGSPSELVRNESFAHLGYYFNRSARRDLGSKVRCVCQNRAPVWPNTTTIMRTGWLPEGFHECVEPRSIFSEPAPWCACGMHADKDQSCGSGIDNFASAPRSALSWRAYAGSSKPLPPPHLPPISLDSPSPPAPALVAEYCKWWCEPHSAAWDVKCKSFPSCRSCRACGGEARA